MKNAYIIFHMKLYKPARKIQTCVLIVYLLLFYVEDRQERAIFVPTDKKIIYEVSLLKIKIEPTFSVKQKEMQKLRHVSPRNNEG